MENLEWNTESENSIHVLKNGRKKNMRQLQNIRKRRIARITEDGIILQEFNSIKEAELFYNVRLDSIGSVLRKGNKKFKNMYFKYI